MERLTEKEMRLLVGIVLDASAIARLTKADDESEEMKKAVELIALSNKMVAICNEVYPVANEVTDGIFGYEE